MMRGIKRVIRYFFIIIPITSFYLMCFLYETTVLFKQGARDSEKRSPPHQDASISSIYNSDHVILHNQVHASPLRDDRPLSPSDLLGRKWTGSTGTLNDDRYASQGVMSLQQISYGSSGRKQVRRKKHGHSASSDSHDDNNNSNRNGENDNEKLSHSSVSTSTLSQPIKLVLKKFKPTTISLSDLNIFYTPISSSTLLDISDFTFIKDARDTCVTGARNRVTVSVTSDTGTMHNDEKEATGRKDAVNLSLSSLSSLSTSPPVSAYAWSSDLPSSHIEDARGGIINNEPAVKPFLLAFIHSAPSNFARRDVIRRTWASPSTLSSLNVRAVFILGLSIDRDINSLIDNESQKYSDVVQGNFIDSYKNLTYKHLAGYKWVMSHCNESTFVMKVDDDAFVDIFKVVSTLKYMFTSSYKGDKLNTMQPGGVLACSVFPEGTPVQRNGKWALSYTEYPLATYPEYCSGVAYFASTDVLFKLFNKAHETTANGMLKTKPIWIDDLYVTGTLASLAKQKHLPMNFQFAYDHRRLRNWLARRDSKSNSYLIADIGDVSDWQALMTALWAKTQRISS